MKCEQCGYEMDHEKCWPDYFCKNVDCDKYSEIVIAEQPEPKCKTCGDTGLICDEPDSEYPDESVYDCPYCNQQEELKPEDVTYAGYHFQWWVDTVEDLLKIIDGSTTINHVDKYIKETEEAVKDSWTTKPMFTRHDAGKE